MSKGHDLLLIHSAKLSPEEAKSVFQVCERPLLKLIPLVRLEKSSNSTLQA